MSRARRVGAPLLGLLVAFTAWRCAHEPPSEEGSGGVQLEFRDLVSGSLDSILVRISDRDGRTVAGPVTVAVTDSVATRIALDVPAGADRRVDVVGTGPSRGFEQPEARGIVAEGRSTTFAVRRGLASDVHVRLSSRVPSLEPITAAPGDLSYTVRWGRIEGAESYRLEGERRGSVAGYDLTDTARTFDLLPFDPTRYRVRARLAAGPTAFSDSVGFDPAVVSDLPRVIAILPLDGASDAPDTTSPTLFFDRPMDWDTVTESSVRLEPAGGGGPLVVVRRPTAGTALRLAPAAPLVRGVEYAVIVETSLRDASGRPLDQAPSVAGLQPFRSTFAVEPHDPLRVLETVPADADTAVDPAALIDIVFDRPAAPATLTATHLILSDSTSGVLEHDVTVLEGGVRARLRPRSALPFGARIEILATTGVRDLARGEPLDQDPSTLLPDPFRSRFRVAPQPAGPRVIAVSPLDLEPNAPVFLPVRVRFDGPVDPISVTTSTLSVRRLPLGAIIPGSIQAGADPQEFLFVPAVLERDTRYRVVVTSGVSDPDGHPLDQDLALPGYQEFSSTFRTERNPQVQEVDPLDDAVRVSVSTVVSVRFSLPILPASVNDTTFVLRSGSTVVPAARELSADSTRATLVPLVPLEDFTVYDVAVTTSVRTRRGSRLDQDLAAIGHQAFASRFTTQPESIPPRVIEVSPIDGAGEVPPRPIVRVRFDEPVLPASINATTVLLRALPSGPTLAGALALSPDSLEATFSPAADLTPLTRHEVRVTTWVQDRYDVRLDQDPVAPDRQDFVSEFLTADETIPPRVTAVDPPDGALGVLPESEVRVWFSEAMAPSPLGEEAFALLSDGARIPGAVTFSKGGALLTFDPDAPLLSARKYDVLVDTLATDPAGNLLDQDASPGPRRPFRASFTTQSDELGPRVLASSPPDGGENVLVDATLGFRFSEPLEAASVVPTAFAVEDSTGAAVQIGEALLTGPDSVTVSLSEPLRFDTRYTMRAEPVLADSAGNLFDQDPDTPGDQPFVASFSTQAETVPPRVIGLRLDGEPAPVDTRVRIGFSEPIQPGSVSPSTIRLRRSGVLVPITVSLAGPDSALAEPVGHLAYETQYQVEVEGVADTIGNLLDQTPETPGNEPFVAIFTTETDVTPPRVLELSPADSDSGVLTDVRLRIVFSEPMDPASVTSSNLQLRRIPGGQVLETEIMGDAVAAVFEVQPVSALEPGESYEVRATYFLQDEQGLGLDQDPGTPQQEPFVSTFHVGFPPVADAGAPACDPADSVRVTVDATGSLDPDGEIVEVTWDWGDGTIETLNAPEGLSVSHSYPCLDLRGCNGLDDDSDGSTDEAGPSGCDESYRILLTVEDDDGARATDEIGVSFCALLAIGAEPPPGSDDVDSTVQVVRVRFSRPIDSGSVGPGDLLLTSEAGDTLSGVYGVEEAGVVLVFAFDEPLAAGTDYTARLQPTVVGANGLGFDQEPCTPGAQAFVWTFRTEAASRMEGRVAPGLRPPSAPQEALRRRR